MARIFSRIAQAYVALALIVSATPVLAANDPIPGVDIIVRKNPGNNLVVQTHTDATGKFTASLAPGRYTLELTGPGLSRGMIAAMLLGNPLLSMHLARSMPVLSAKASFVRSGAPKAMLFEFTIPASAGGKALAYSGQITLKQ